MIHDGRLHWAARPDGVEPLPWPAGRTAGRIEALRNSVVLVTVLLYLLLNWGFMQLRIPPGGGGGRAPRARRRGVPQM